MLKNQVFSTYLYQNQDCISNYILYFLEKVHKIRNIMILGTQISVIFDFFVTKIITVYRPVICKF